MFTITNLAAFTYHISLCGAKLVPCCYTLHSLKAALKHNDSFPVGVIISLHDGGELHVWPGSFDTMDVNEKDRVTVRLNAGDIILFHGALIHAGAGYEGDDGEYHLRLHFYTQTAHGRDAWPVVNKTELVRHIDDAEAVAAAASLLGFKFCAHEHFTALSCAW